jgi:hypothetical protein
MNMNDPYNPPQAILREPPTSEKGGRPVLAWIIAAYSIVTAISSYTGLVMLFSTDRVVEELPAYEHYFAYFLPGVTLTAGVALCWFRKVALPLYAAHFVLHLAQPAIMSSVYRIPYLSYSLLDIYRKALSITPWLPVAWAVWGLIAAYVWSLYKRDILK